MTTSQKNAYMRHLETSTTTSDKDIYIRLIKQWTDFQPIWNNQTNFHWAKIGYLLVPKLYHDKAREGFMSVLRYADKMKTVGRTPSEYGSVLYICKSPTTRTSRFSYSTVKTNFPEEYSKTSGISLRVFAFNFQNLDDSLKKLLELSSDLINKETGVEQTSSVPTRALFFPEEKVIEDAIKDF